MSRDVPVATAEQRHAPRATLNHLCHEIVQGEVQAVLWGRHGQWDREEWWNVYLERLRAWHWALVRRRSPRMQQSCPTLLRCPDCSRVQDAPSGLARCFACGASWLAHV